jgi:phage terminase small subunit
MSKTRKVEKTGGEANESQASALDSTSLNERQKKFCEGYIFDWNATRAYMAAYPDTTYDSARVSASTLLTNPNIKAYIEELKSKTAELAGVSLLRVVNEYAKLAFTDAASLRTDWNDVKDWDELTEAERSLISGITTTKRTIGSGEEKVEIEETKLDYKTHDKHKALEALRKIYGYDAAEKTENKSTVTVIQKTRAEIEAELEEIRKRRGR